MSGDSISMGEMGALLSTFTHISNIAKAMLKLRDFAQVNSKMIELQGAIIIAQQQAIGIQQGYSALEAKTRELEAECMRLKDWSSEKEKYTAREIASGVFAYVENGVVDDFEQAHKYCSNCFDQGQKSLLQKFRGEKGGIGVKCPRCKFEVKFLVFMKPTDRQTSIKPFRG